MKVLSMQTRKKILLVVLINFVLPLPVLFQAFNIYFDYALNLSFLALLVFGTIDLKTDKREFKALLLMKIIQIILYIYYIIIQVGYPLVNTILGFSLPLFFLQFIVGISLNLFRLMLIISYSFIFLLIFAFVLFGFKNRRYYGNHLIAFAILYLVHTIFNLILDFPLTFNDVFNLIFIYASVILVSISASYLIFFGQRIRTLYFTLSGFAFFGAIFAWWVFEFIRYIVFNIEIYHLIVIIIALIGIVVSGRFIEVGTTFKRGVRVFITHAVDDYGRYRINDIAHFLEKQKGIRYVYYCEADLTGNIDAWMQKTVPRCQLLLLMSTEKSLSSADCVTELNLARDTGLTIIPILGVGLNWDDLKKLDVHREIGASFDPMEFEDFCNKLYQQIQIYKKSLNQIAENDQPEKKSIN